MGTSTSHSGPGDGPGLLPDWAILPNAEPEPDDSDILDGEDAESIEAGESGDEAVDQDVAPVQPRLWQNAKTQMTRWAGGDGGDRGLRSAASAYVRSRGGAGAASTAARSGRAATANVGRFLGGVAARGLNSALTELGLSQVIGQDAETVLAAISNRLAPPGNTKEEIAARRAINDVLAYLHAQYVTDGDLTALETLDDEAIASAVGDSVVAYIYHRWLDDLGLSIEKGAISESKAVELERQVRLYVRHSVNLAFENRDLVTVDWSSPATRRLITGIYRDAYAILEAAQ